MSRLVHRSRQEPEDAEGRADQEPVEDTTDEAPVESAADHTIIETTMVSAPEDRTTRPRKRPARERR